MSHHRTLSAYYFRLEYSSYLDLNLVIYSVFTDRNVWQCKAISKNENEMLK